MLVNKCMNILHSILTKHSPNVWVGKKYFIILCEGAQFLMLLKNICVCAMIDQESLPQCLKPDRIAMDLVLTTILLL